MTKLEVGKCYYCGEFGSEIYRIESRTETSAKIAWIRNDGSIIEISRKKIYTENYHRYNGDIQEERTGIFRKKEFTRMASQNLGLVTISAQGMKKTSLPQQQMRLSAQPTMMPHWLHSPRLS